MIVVMEVVVEVMEVVEVADTDMLDPVMNKDMEKVLVKKELGNKEVCIKVWEWSLMSLIHLENCLPHHAPPLGYFTETKEEWTTLSNRTHWFEEMAKKQAITIKQLETKLAESPYKRGKCMKDQFF